MKNQKIENVVGALAVGLSDALLQGAENLAPEPGQAAAAITLLRHEPGMPIELLRRALHLSHPGTVRLVDRLVKNDLVERRRSLEDKRAVALHLTDEGEKSCDAILASRQNRLERALKVFSAEERETFGLLAQKLLKSLVENADHGYSVCRLCNLQACPQCPVEAALEEQNP